MAKITGTRLVAFFGAMPVFCILAFAPLVVSELSRSTRHFIHLGTDECHFVEGTGAGLRVRQTYRYRVNPVGAWDGLTKPADAKRIERSWLPVQNGKSSDEAVACEVSTGWPVYVFAARIKQNGHVVHGVPWQIRSVVVPGVPADGKLEPVPDRVVDLAMIPISPLPRGVVIMALMSLAVSTMCTGAIYYLGTEITRRNRRRRGVCQHCGFDSRGVSCPECGRA